MLCLYMLVYMKGFTNTRLVGSLCYNVTQNAIQVLYKEEQ